jgi:hypothetical protein
MAVKGYISIKIIEEINKLPDAFALLGNTQFRLTKEAQNPDVRTQELIKSYEYMISAANKLNQLISSIQKEYEAEIK